jgi:hypothetical protein
VAIRLCFQADWKPTYKRLVEYARISTRKLLKYSNGRFSPHSMDENGHVNIYIVSFSASHPIIDPTVALGKS